VDGARKILQASMLHAGANGETAAGCVPFSIPRNKKAHEADQNRNDSSKAHFSISDQSN